MSRRDSRQMLEMTTVYKWLQMLLRKTAIGCTADELVGFLELPQMVRYSIVMAAIFFAAPAYSAPLKTDCEAASSNARVADDQPEKRVTSVSQRFRTLDDYLAFLESRSVIDGHWYREMRPGIYRLEVGNYHGPEIEKRIFTREELLRKFGFSLEDE